MLGLSPVPPMTNPFRERSPAGDIGPVFTFHWENVGRLRKRLQEAKARAPSPLDFELVDCPHIPQRRLQANKKSRSLAELKPRPRILKAGHRPFASRLKLSQLPELRKPRGGEPKTHFKAATSLFVRDISKAECESVAVLRNSPRSKNKAERSEQEKSEAAATAASLSSLAKIVLRKCNVVREPFRHNRDTLKRGQEPPRLSIRSHNASSHISLKS